MADYTKIIGVAAADIVKVSGVAIADVTKFKGAEKPSSAYDWTFSLFTDDNIASFTTLHGSPNDQWDGAGGYYRGLNTINYKLNLVPYLDDSSGTPTLHIAHCGHAGDAADDFQEVFAGSQVGSGNNDLVCRSTTGVTFSGGNMVDGLHFLKWKHKHDAKSDTHFTVTAVLDCTSNVLEARAHWQSHGTLQSGGYVSKEYALASGTLYWKLTWDPASNTWTVDTSDDDWQALGNANVSITTSGGSVSKGTTDYSIIDSDPEDSRMWEITVGTP